MKRSTQSLRELKGVRPIVALTAYDAIMAHWAEEAGVVDLLLVGDSVGTTQLGFTSTLPVTLEMMIHHCRAARAGTREALLVVDLPFGRASASIDQLLEDCRRLLQEGGAEAVKLEGGAWLAPSIERLTRAGIPVVGHIGLQPQQFHQLGGYRRFGAGEEAEQLLEDGRALEAAGAFCIVAEMLRAEVAETLTRELTIPLIGIGCGDCSCDGQILVTTDLLGLTPGNVPSFVTPYAQLGGAMRDAFKAWADDLKEVSGA